MSTVGCHGAPPLGGILVSQSRGGSKPRRRTCSSCHVVKRKADFPPSLSNDDPICRGCVMLASPTCRKVDSITMGGQEMGDCDGRRVTTSDECGGANRLSPLDRDGSLSSDIPTTVYAPPIRLTATKAPQFVLASGAEFA